MLLLLIIYAQEIFLHYLGIYNFNINGNLLRNEGFKYLFCLFHIQYT